MKALSALLAIIWPVLAQPSGTLRVRVIGTDGKPTAHVNVSVDGQSAATNSEGSLSLTLREALYAVSAELAEGSTVPPGMAVETPQPQYVFVRGGTEVSYDIHFRMVPLNRVRGFVKDLNGKPVPNTIISLVRPRRQGLAISEQRDLGGSTSSSFNSGVFEPDDAVETIKSGTLGEFEFFAVPSGTWHFRAEAGSSADSLLRGSATASVSQDIRNLEIQLARKFPLDVAFEWEGKSEVAETFRNGAATLIWLDSPKFEYSSADYLLARAQQSLHLYCGRYLIRVWPPGVPGFYPASVLLGNREVLGREFTLTADSPRLRIIYRQGAGTIRVDIEQGVQATFVLYPRVLSGGQIIRTTRCGLDGTCELTNIIPGDYHAVAFRTVNRAYLLAETSLIGAVVPDAPSVHISEGAAVAFQLPVVRCPD